MQNKNHWYRNFRFKLFAVLCAIAVLASAVLVSGPVLASPAAANPARAAAATASDRDYSFSVISRGAGKLDIFVVDCYIFMKSWTGSTWTNWLNLGRSANNECFFTVSAVAAGNNRWDIFSTVGGASSTVWHKAFDGVVEYGWESRGSVGNGSSGYGVQAVSTGNGRIDIFTRATCSSTPCGQAGWKSRSASGVWNPCDTCNWSALDNTLTDFSFSALAHSGNRINIFRRKASDQIVKLKYYTGTAWGPVNPFNGQQLNMWQDMSGGLAKETPYGVSWGTNRIDVFVRGSDDNVWIDSTGDAGSSWSGWSSLGRGSTSIDTKAVSAVAWGPNRLDIFSVEGGMVYNKSWNGTSWSGWGNIGNSVAYVPLPVSWGPNRIDLFRYELIAGSKTLYHKWTNDGTNWGPTQNTWESLGHP